MCSVHSFLVGAHLLPQKCLKLSLSWLEIYCEIPDGLFISAYALNVHQNQRYRRAVLYFYSIYTSWVSIDQLVNMYLKGFGPPIIKGTGLYKLIIVWRGFIMTVHIVVWVITLMISLCCSIYHEILLFLK